MTMDDIFGRSEETEPPKSALQFKHKGIRRLVTLCRELQRAVGDDSFFLGQPTVGKLMGIHPSTAKSWLRKLCDAGILRLVERGGAPYGHDGEKNKAHRYVYTGGD